MDFRLPKQTYDFDAWLSEDLTEEYDRIIRERKRRRILRRWAAAAAIIGTIFILGITLNPGNTKSDEKLPTASTSEPRVEPSGSLPGELDDAACYRRDARKSEFTPGKVQVCPEQSPGLQDTPKKVVRNTARHSVVTPSDADSLQFYITKLERELEQIGDSISTAQGDMILRADAQLQQLVKKILIDRLDKED